MPVCLNSAPFDVLFLALPRQSEIASGRTGKERGRQRERERESERERGGKIEGANGGW